MYERTNYASGIRSSHSPCSQYCGIQSAKRREGSGRFAESAIQEIPVELPSDEEVAALTELRLPSEQEAKLSELLAGHREGELNDEEKRELDELMKIHERGILRQSKALREGVARGLRGPLEP